MAYRTLTYSETSKGFPSFYDYEPDFLQGMNNYFYSFKNGNLWRHNSATAGYADFYGAGTEKATISSVFNDSPLQTKLFKTIELHSDTAWTTGNLVANAPKTGQQRGGVISGPDFEQKEGAWYSYIRNVATLANEDIPSEDYGLRSVKGIGIPTTVTNPNTAACVFVFPTTLSSTLSVGDYLYQGAGVGSIIGVVTDMDFTTNTVTINNDTAALPSLTLAAVGLYTYYVQDSQAESHGIIGHYMEFTLSLASGSASELFAVESDVMKSYP